MLTALACLVLAVGLDFVEGLVPEHPWNLYTWIAERYELEPWTAMRFGESAYDTLRHFSKSLEEAIEMLANTLLWYLFLRHLQTVAANLHVRISGAPP
jgi:hypothetical protein